MEDQNYINSQVYENTGIDFDENAEVEMELNKRKIHKKKKPLGTIKSRYDQRKNSSLNLEQLMQGYLRRKKIKYII